MLIPYKVDVLQRRRPYANYVIIALAILAFILVRCSEPEQRKPYILEGWSILGMLGYMWLHLGYLHIILNLIFLWVFGNALCAKVGNAIYVVIYLASGILAGVMHLVFEEGAVIGASGAIFGVIGTYLVLYPFNSVKCLIIILFYIRRISVAGLWIIIWWIILNILGAVTEFTTVTGVAYFAHIGGFIGGFIFGILILQFKIVERDSINQAIFRHINE